MTIATAMSVVYLFIRDLVDALRLSSRERPPCPGFCRDRESGTLHAPRIAQTECERSSRPRD